MAGVVPLSGIGCAMGCGPACDAAELASALGEPEDKQQSGREAVSEV